ncbi:MAG: diguanylate cyclase [Gammaproteobacteria bacterium]|nr:diguanylate cyclase [Gammaproteobacteria bacterium]
MPIQPATFFDPAKTFDDNVDNGPYLSNQSQSAPAIEKGPGYKFLGLQINSPFGIPSGPLPTSRHIIGAFKSGFDVVCYKTQRSVAFPCNPFPNVVYIDVEGDLTLEKATHPQTGHLHSSAPLEKLTITNSFGNPCRGPDFWVDDLRKAVQAQGKGQLCIGSVVGTIQEGFNDHDYFKDFAATALLAKCAGVQAIELNLSCPNVASEGVLCYTYEAVYQVCKLTKEAVGDVPLIAKMGYFTPDQQPLLEKIVLGTSPYLGAYSVINTLQAAIVDEQGNQFLPGPGRLKAGCCGASIKWAGLDMVKRLAALREKHRLNFDIMGVGGVMTPEHFLEYRNAGADVVQSATAVMWNDRLAQQIKTTL